MRLATLQIAVGLARVPQPVPVTGGDGDRPRLDGREQFIGAPGEFVVGAQKVRPQGPSQVHRARGVESLRVDRRNRPAGRAVQGQRSADCQAGQAGVERRPADPVVHRRDARAPPAAVRSWKIGGYPLSEGLTRDDYRRSFAKMVELVGKLHQAGVRIVAGTDGSGLELVRELELYSQAGLSNAEALQTATIIPARMTGMADRTGSIAPGKTADIILVDGDVSKDLGNLRHVDTVFLDGYRLGGKALREASGLSGMPK